MKVLEIVSHRLIPEQIEELKTMPFIYDLEEFVLYLKTQQHTIETTPDLKERIGKFIVSMNYKKLNDLHEPKEIFNFKNLMQHVCRAIIDDIQKTMNQVQKAHLKNEISSAFEEAERLYGYNADELKQLLGIDKVLQMSVPTQQFQASAPMFHLSWVGDIKHLETLARLLHKDYAFIKTEASFINLFSNEPKKRKLVKWNKEKVYHLARLLFELNANGYIKCSTGKKEHFKIAQKWFIDFDEQKFAKDLKGKSSRISLKKEEYQTEIQEIQGLITDMKKSSESTD